MRELANAFAARDSETTAVRKDRKNSRMGMGVAFLFLVATRHSERRASSWRVDFPRISAL